MLRGFFFYIWDIFRCSSFGCPNGYMAADSDDIIRMLSRFSCSKLRDFIKLIDYRMDVFIRKACISI